MSSVTRANITLAALVGSLVVVAAAAFSIGDPFQVKGTYHGQIENIDCPSENDDAQDNQAENCTVSLRIGEVFPPISLQASQDVVADFVKEDWVIADYTDRGKTKILFSLTSLEENRYQPKP